MSGVEKTVDAMYDPTILKTKRVLLVENVIFENVMPCIRGFLNFNQIDTIDGEKTKGDKIRKVLEYIERLTEASQYEPFYALMMAIAGTQPELFTSLLGRDPTDSERMFCVKDIAQNLREKIMKTGHCTDSKLDETICFDYDYVQLLIVDRNSELESTREVPHEYSEHLTRRQDTGSTISASDILNSESKPNEKVLVFGRPGVGKSTTTQWLSRQWALGKWLTGVTVLFLLQAKCITNVDFPITAIDLLTVYSLYQLEDMADSLVLSSWLKVLSSWLKNPASRILIFIDGLDEIPGFANKINNTRRIGDLTHKAHPIELIVNILRGDLLPHSLVISASRPFLGLNNLPVNSKAEVLGLTSRKVTEYVERRYPEKANHILSVLERNHILSSVCGITFYCMMISRLLSEGVILIDEEVQTYTRLMAFILVQYTSRKIPDSSFSLETNNYFSKLANIAFFGIFQSQDGSKLAKIVFHERDLIQCNFSTNDLNHIKKTGIVQITEKKIGHDKSVVAEFFHLSGQEMLAVLHFLSNSACADDILTPLCSGGHFDMALMYTFGLNFDKTSTWVDKLWTAMGSSNPSTDPSITSELSRFIDTLCKNSANKIKVCQLLFEAQWMDKAKEVFSHIAPNGDLSMKNMPMTAIDILAVDFVCKCAGSLSSIRLNSVNADATCVQVMMSSLFKHNLKTLQVLDISFNTIGTDGVKAIAKTLGPTSNFNIGLKTLNISTNGIGAEGAVVMGDMLKHNISLETLNISYNSIGDAGAEAMANMLKHNSSLQKLNISDNDIGAAGAETMADMLKHNISLQALDISANSIGAAGAEAMANMLGHNSSLQTLNMSGNSVGDAGVGALAEMANSNTSLQTLNISDNSVGAAGAKAMATMLEANNNLQTLLLYNNSIGDAGVEAMAEGLKLNTSLQTLSISNNSIGATGARAIANMLKQNSRMEKLDISCNSISDTGAEAMADMLKYNKTLLSLVMHNNRISGRGAVAMAAGIIGNTTLNNLYIKDRHIRPAGKRALTVAKQQRHTLKIWV